MKSIRKETNLGENVHTVNFTDLSAKLYRTISDGRSWSIVWSSQDPMAFHTATFIATPTQHQIRCLNFSPQSRFSRTRNPLAECKLAKLNPAPHCSTKSIFQRVSIEQPASDRSVWSTKAQIWKANCTTNALAKILFSQYHFDLITGRVMALIIQARAFNQISSLRNPNTFARVLASLQFQKQFQFVRKLLLMADGIYSLSLSQSKFQIGMSAHFR